MTETDVATAFAAYLNEEAKLSPRTQKLYAFIARRAKDYPAPEDLLRDELLSMATRRMYAKGLLQYAAFLTDAGLKDRIREAIPIGGPRRSRPVAALSWRKEWPALIEQIDKLRVEDPPMWAVLRVLIFSGMRISDVLALTLADFQRALKEGSIAIVQQKTQRERAFIVTEPIWEAVELLVIGGWPTVEEALVTKRCKARKAVEDRIRRDLAQCGELAGITLSVTPYVCRRTMADAIRRAGKGDLKLVQEYLGHAKIETTQVWYQDHLHLDELSEVAEKALTGIR